MPLIEEFQTMSDGARVFVRHWRPDAEPRGVVHLVHGMAEHAGRYAPLANALVENGYAMIAEDHRGHGRTARSPDELGHFADHDGWQRVITDLATVHALAAERHPGVPRCLFGHSMGSFFAQTYALARPHEFDALILSGTSAGGGLARPGQWLARAERRRGGARGRSALLEWLSFSAYNKGFEPTRTEADWLSRDPVEVDRYIADPLCGFRCTNQLWVDLLGALVDLGNARFERLPKDLPVYLFSGAKDPVSQQTRGVQKLIGMLQRAGLRRVTHKFYPDARHECLNETCRTEVIADIIAWLDANLHARRTVSGISELRNSA